MTLVIGWSITCAHADRFDWRTYGNVMGPFIQYIGLSQVRAKGGEAGFPFGHSVMYVHGLCRDPDAKFPRVVPCKKLKNPTHSGVGISVENTFKNVQWVAVPGYDLFLYGNQPVGKPITDDDFYRVREEVTNLNIFEGVEIHDRYAKEIQGATSALAQDPEIIHSMVSSEFAIAWGRETRKVTFPIQEERIERLSEFLNELNDYFHSGKQDYVMNVLTDHCVHFNIRLCEIAGVRKALGSTSQGLFGWVDYLTTGRNGYVVLHVFSHGDWSNLMKAERQFLEKEFIETGYTPRRHGAISHFESIMDEGANAYYEQKVKSLAFPPRPLLRCKQLLDQSNAIFENPKYIHFRDLNENLLYWKKYYQDELSRLSSLGAPQTALDKRYADWLPEALKDVERLLLSRSR